jgi:tRNA(Arg) A34 adenosine deaminase TadA
MVDFSSLSPLERDVHFLRRSFDVARRAVTHGNHPFGALLVDRSGTVLIEVENGYMPSHDSTAHAERLLATQACTTLSSESSKRQLSIRPQSPARCAQARSTGLASAAWSTG